MKIDGGGGIGALLRLVGNKNCSLTRWKLNFKLLVFLFKVILCSYMFPNNVTF